MRLDKSYARRTAEKREIWSMKMTPRLKYLATLAARGDGKTLSSLVEYELEQSLLRIKIIDDQEGVNSENVPGQTIAELADDLYCGSEGERFLKLVSIAPHFVSDGEAKILRIVQNSDYFSPLNKGYRQLHHSRILKNWDVLAAIRDGGELDLLPEEQQPSGALKFGLLNDLARTTLFKTDPEKFRTDNEAYQRALKGKAK